MCISVYVVADMHDIAKVYRELLPVAHKWMELGLVLGLHINLLYRIKVEIPDVTRCLREVLFEWLQQAYNTSQFELPSWKLLVEAVAHPGGGNDPALARRIAIKHNGI